jgi:RNA polymerase-binding transcription factor DksA
MLNLNRQNIEKIRNKLLRQEKEVEEELKQIDKDDPVLDSGLAESIEPGSASWMADVHSKTVALKENLSQMLGKTRLSLKNLKKGTYGICEKCGKPIEEERLLAYPTATLCIKDSKKSAK